MGLETNIDKAGVIDLDLVCGSCGKTCDPPDWAIQRYQELLTPSDPEVRAIATQAALNPSGGLLKLRATRIA